MTHLLAAAVALPDWLAARSEAAELAKAAQLAVVVLQVLAVQRRMAARPQLAVLLRPAVLPRLAAPLRPAVLPRPVVALQLVVLPQRAAALRLVEAWRLAVLPPVAAVAQERAAARHQT